MIADMKSVEHPARKMYIKATIRPSDRATGGAWFTDGELDEEFIEQMMMILYNYIRGKTFYHASSGHSPKRPKKVVKKMTPVEAKAARAKGLGPRAKAEEEVNVIAAKKATLQRYLPMPAGYQGYPTLNELTAYIENSAFTQQTLTAGEIQQLLDILCYDDKIERLVSGAEGFAYRALRKSLMDEDDVGSLLTEAPCGRCPVFDLCEEGGPVGPSNCEYFNDWLSL
jgi:DNA-directed RNA polymerase III subunit RPC6